MSPLDRADAEWRRAIENGRRRRWPYRSRPRSDELLSSWFLRCAAGMWLKPFALGNAVWGRSLQILTRDIDNFAPPSLVAGMAALTDTPLEAAWGTSLAEFEGRLVERYTMAGRTNWIMPLGVRHRRRHQPGLQFCPACLQEPISYYRRIWRLAWSTVCCRHGCILLDRCPSCAAPLEPHRAPHLWLCATCRTDLRTVDAAAAPPGLAALQARHEEFLRRGWAELGRVTFPYSHLYFELVRQVARVLFSGARSERLRISVSGSVAQAPGFLAVCHDVETLSADDRRRLMSLVALALQDWPTRFVAAAREAGFWRSWATRDRPRLPFAFASIVDEHLGAGFYTPAREEVRAAEMYLRRVRPGHGRQELRNLVGDCQAVWDVFNED
ncbi:hypothetical protein SGCZBJ_04280 [Caulobacter zeae]|uniref:TniQ domain-containing protein n=1 Tax=Caulobacter zeae TaxID=2055137 RepID=A0A2N5DQ92_9CAUL|nr:hypothetical protein SGCZBJ_04280 [Caulobacter zeae]